jgi:hypothetical protein
MMISGEQFKMIVLRYWAGSEKPLWRAGCEAQVARLYPDADIVEYVDNGKGSKSHSDQWRIQKCSENPNTLWIDSDIWLNAPLSLTEKPGMIFEYSCPHWSLIWSGSRPDVFANMTPGKLSKKIFEMHRKKEADLYTIDGYHWASDGNRKPIERKHHIEAWRKPQ